MFYIMLIALALTGELLPAESDKFYITSNVDKPIIFERKGDDLWSAKIVDQQNQRYIPFDEFHINGLAVGKRSGDVYDYYDITEILPVKTLNQLTKGEHFSVDGGNIFINHGKHEIWISYSPNDITSQELSLRVLWPEKSSDEMILAVSSERKLTNDDVGSLDVARLRLARNEIFARHGYKFSSKELAYYFEATSWYRPVDTSVQLSDIERYNVEYLRMLEDEILRSDDVKVSVKNENYLIGDSAGRLLSKDELAIYSPAELRLIRNEIFARHGYIFKFEDLNRYFSQQSWYQPSTADVSLSSIEAKNVHLLKALESTN
jgi:hypothetical protein